jgi:predicted transcriptional regulator
MGKYRSRLQIIADVLSVVSGGAKKTRIMYQANLSYKLLTRYLGDVLEAGLVRGGNDDCYELTQKGREFLARFDDYFVHRQSAEEKLNHVMDEKVKLENTYLNANTRAANFSSRKRKEREEPT